MHEYFAAMPFCSGYIGADMWIPIHWLFFELLIYLSVKKQWLYIGKIMFAQKFRVNCCIEKWISIFMVFSSLNASYATDILYSTCPMQLFHLWFCGRVYTLFSDDVQEREFPIKRIGLHCFGLLCAFCWAQLFVHFWGIILASMNTSIQVGWQNLPASNQ